MVGPEFDEASLRERVNGRVRGLVRDAARICITGREVIRPRLDAPLLSTVIQARGVLARARQVPR